MIPSPPAPFGASRHFPRLAGAELRAVAASLLLSLTVACSAPAGQTVSFENGVITATGWSGPEPSAGWQSVLTITAGDDPSSPPLLGDYTRQGSTLIFTPRFPPAPGVTLNVRYQPNDGPALAAAFGEPAKALAPEAVVTAIHPSAETWPANTLRMYVEFSHPMAKGEAWTHLRVRDPSGAIIEDPFVEIDQELWDPEGRRLTVLFDPGRVKRGLVDNRESGPPLVEGRTVTLEVDPAWRDARGAPLASGFSRPIRVGAVVRIPVAVKDWTVEPPSSPQADLVIRFPRPLDHALASRAISVSRETAPIDGQVTLEASDMLWRFTPSSPWSPGDYEVVVDGIIEDVAGNRLGKVFDVDTSDPTQSTVADAEARIGFSVRAR